MSHITINQVCTTGVKVDDPQTRAAANPRAGQQQPAGCLGSDLAVEASAWKIIEIDHYLV